MFSVRFFPSNCVTIFYPPERPVDAGELFAEHLVFVWDGLLDPAAVRALLGRPVPFAPAVLPGFARNGRRKREEWDFDLTAQDEAHTAGVVLIGVTDAELELLDDFEQAPIHRLRQKGTVRIGDLERVAEVYLVSGAYFDE